MATCDPQVGCVTSDVLCADDGVTCRPHVCDPVHGECVERVDLSRCGRPSSTCMEPTCLPDGTCDERDACAAAGLGVCVPGNDACNIGTECPVLCTALPDRPCLRQMPACEDVYCPQEALNAGDPCDVDLCHSGHCDDAGRCVSDGTSMGCDDGNPCTADLCDPEVGCVNEVYADTSVVACDTDRDPCTNQYCVAGECVAVPACDPPGECSELIRCDGCQMRARDGASCGPGGCGRCDGTGACIPAPCPADAGVQVTCGVFERECDGDCCTRTERCDPMAGCVPRHDCLSLPIPCGPLEMCCPCDPVACHALTDLCFLCL